MSRASTVAAALSFAACVCGCASHRDVIPESHDVRGEPNAVVTTAHSPDGYVHVARRRVGVVALAEARGVSDEVASRIVDKLADALDACASDLAQKGKLAQGAARIVAEITKDGAATNLNIKLSPGAAVAANAIICVITPLKLAQFPLAEADAGTRGIAIEATWEPPAASGATGAGGVP